MTAQRPYRMTPLTAEQALAELRKFAGIQFDPAVVDAFVRTTWVDGVQDPGRRVESAAHPADRPGGKSDVAGGDAPGFGARRAGLTGRSAAPSHVGHQRAAGRLNGRG